MSWLKIHRLAAALTVLLIASSAAAQIARAIPASAERAWMRPLGGMMLEMNGEPMRLGAGAQIRDTSNRIVLPATLPAEAPVKYTLDVQGQVHRVWILTAEEAAQPEPEKQ
ncbi:MAG: hypothetical protein P8Y76_14280 [bacterium]